MRTIRSLVLLTLLSACSSDDGATKASHDAGIGGSATGGTGAGGGGGTGNTSSGGVGGSSSGGSAGSTSGGTGGASGGSGGVGTGGGSGSPGAPLFFDDFEYQLDKGDVNAASVFQTQGGWTWAKTMPANPGANGHLYTTTSVLGSNAPLPGLASSRVLKLEAHAATGQTDFYLKLGDSESAASDDKIPGNVWFQFWIYVNHTAPELSQIDGRDKFIYPCNGPYPCNTGKWLFMIGAQSYNPLNASPYGVPSTGEAFLISRDNQVGSVVYGAAAPGDEGKLGQNDINTYLAPNQWNLVKIHYDTSTTFGTFEAWIRPGPSASFAKVAEWIHGVTPNFTWNIPPSEVGGHRAFAMPTTIPGNNASGSDSWIYMDDFAMAAAEQDLPVY